jgi:hypothetical protein
MMTTLPGQDRAEESSQESESDRPAKKARIVAEAEVRGDGKSLLTINLSMGLVSDSADGEPAQAAQRVVLKVVGSATEKEQAQLDLYGALYPVLDATHAGNENVERPGLVPPPGPDLPTRVGYGLRRLWFHPE